MVSRASATWRVVAVILMLPLGMTQNATSQTPDGLQVQANQQGYENLLASAQTQNQSTSIPFVARIDYDANSNNISGPTPAPSPALSPFGALAVNEGRKLLQTVAVRNLYGSTKFKAFINIQASGATQEDQGPFLTTLDTGSDTLLLPGNADPNDPDNKVSYDVGGLNPVPGSAFQGLYNGGGGGFSRRRGSFYNVAFLFTGAPTTTTNTEAAVVSETSYPADTKPPPATTCTDDPSIPDSCGTPRKSSNTLIGLGVSSTRRTPVSDAISQNTFPSGAFTVDYLRTDPLTLATVPGGSFTLGPKGPNARLTNVDEACVEQAAESKRGGNTWEVDISGFTLATASGTIDIAPACTVRSPCPTAVDTGAFAIVLDPNAANALYAALGIDTATARTTKVQPQRGASYYQVACNLKAATTPVLQFRIGDRIYSMTPNEYIEQIVIPGQSDACFVNVEASKPGDGFIPFLLGDPFITKYPMTFYANGIPAPGGPSPLVPGSSFPTICIYGTVPVEAQCKAPITLPATANCARRISEADLLTLINDKNPLAIFTSPIPGPASTVFTILPPPAADGFYTLPVGAPISFTVTATAAGVSDSCTTSVTVTDQEQLLPNAVQCGALPPNGVVELPLLPDKSKPFAVYTPSYVKTNGCPVTVSVSNLECKDCLLGDKASGLITKCESTTDGTKVNISPEQKGRVTWTVTVTSPPAKGSVSTTCGVCVDKGDLLTDIGKCPRPFTPATTCTAGFL